MSDDKHTKQEMETLEKRLQHIWDRVQWIADEEARSAWIQGIAARGAYSKEKMRLIKETDDILDRLQKLRYGDHTSKKK